VLFKTVFALITGKSNYSKFKYFDIFGNRVFHKKMSVPELEKYIDDEKFKFLVVETFELKCCGFNLKTQINELLPSKLFRM
jgi:hypothetical protein